jgi:hypothetical protein
MNKRLRFAQDLVPLIRSGEKVSTWRLWDDKDLTVGDIVNFIEYGTDIHFATGKLTKIIEKPLGKLTEVDKQGHEKFSSDEEMYTTYTNYYGRAANKDTLVKLIWFELIK